MQIKIEHEKFKNGFFKFIVAYEKEEENSDVSDFGLSLFNWNIHLYWLSPYTKLITQIKTKHEYCKNGLFKFTAAYQKEGEISDVRGFGLSLFNWNIHLCWLSPYIKLLT